MGENGNDIPIFDRIKKLQFVDTPAFLESDECASQKAAMLTGVDSFAATLWF